MEKHYIKDIGEITYVYGVDLEEHKKVIENQQNEIQQLKQQIAEIQNSIEEISREFVQAVHDWKALCAEKDKEIEKLKQELEETNAGNEHNKERIFELEELLKYEKEDKIYIEKQLKQQLTKKVKTIEVLRDLQKYNTTQLAEKQNVIDDINKKFVQAVHDWKILCKKKDKEIEKLRKGEYQKCCQHCEVPKQDANDLVIRELKKVKKGNK